jgi:hypothetical protein
MKNDDYMGVVLKDEQPTMFKGDEDEKRAVNFTKVLLIHSHV